MRKIIPVLTILLLIFCSCSSLLTEEPVVKTTSDDFDKSTIVEVPVINIDPVEDKKEEELSVEPIIEPAAEIETVEEATVSIADITIVEEEVPFSAKEEVPVVMEEIIAPAKDDTKVEDIIELEVVPVVQEETPPAESSAPNISTVTTGFPRPVLDSEISPLVLQLLSVVIVITVVFTIAVAIRGANRMKLQRGISFALAVLFTALSIVISTLVYGWSNLWLLYLLLLLTYFVLRARWRDSIFI